MKYMKLEKNKKPTAFVCGGLLEKLTLDGVKTFEHSGTVSPLNFMVQSKS